MHTDKRDNIFLHVIVANAPKRENGVRNKMKKSDDNQLKVFISSREAKCDECGADLGSHAWIVLKEEERAACLTCADMDHLVFLPSGDTALTRRSRKHSRLAAIVLKWSRARKRYERQGLLVENEALEQAERECKADAMQRDIRRGHAVLRRAELDKDYINRFAARVREIYPHSPSERERLIAEHACRKYSARVGRSAAAKTLDEKAVRLAVAAHVRHAETNYDELLSSMIERQEAREMVRSTVSDILQHWEFASYRDRTPISEGPSHTTVRTDRVYGGSADQAGR